MTLDEILNEFSRRMMAIEIYRRAAKEITEKELVKLGQAAAQLRDSESKEAESVEFHAMLYSDPETGQLRKYGFRDLTIDDCAIKMMLLKNKQYCWLLADAYEAFEDYIEAVFAYLGVTTIDTWTLSDFGEMPPTELTGKDFSCYLALAKVKKGGPNSILTVFRNKFKKLVQLETKNKLSVNLKVAIRLIEKLRHCIVHKGGVVDNRENFLKIVLCAAGVWNNGKYHGDYKGFIERFFGQGDYGKFISLMEIKIHRNVPFHLEDDRFGELSGYLMGYAMLIYKNVVESESKVT